MNISVGTPAERKGLVPCSGIRRVFERTKTLKREGHPVIFLETGKPDFDIRLYIKEAAKRALDAGRDHYMSDYEIPELRAAIATFLARLPSPEVSRIDEHLLVIADRRRNQAEPDGLAGPAKQAITGRAVQISAKRAGQAPPTRPGGRAHTTP